MKRLWEWICDHPVGAVFLALVVALIGAHFAANAHAERRWRQYSDAARARGVKLTLAEIEPPPVPDEQNFASLPMWKAVFDETVKRPLGFPAARGAEPGFGDRVKGEAMDWAAWQKLFVEAGYVPAPSGEPARDVLQGLEHYAPVLAQWSEWRHRPLCRFPLDYQAGMGMPLPHLGTFNDAARLFALRMRAHLALGDSAAAGADFREGLQVYRLIEFEPTLISGLVRVSVLAVLWNGVGEGLRNRQWAEDELRQIEAGLASVDVWQDRQRALAGERAFFNWMYEQWIVASPGARAKILGSLAGPGTAPVSSLPFWLMPKRLFRDNQLRQNYYLDEMLAQVDEAGFHADRTTPSGPEHLRGSISTFYHLFFRMMAPVYDSVLRRYVHMRAAMDQARVAVALERFRLAHGEFPAALDELAPTWIAAIPLDAGSRQPMIYRRAEGGQSFTLYGRGPDGADDGAELDPSKNEGNQKDDVWLYAPEP